MWEGGPVAPSITNTNYRTLCSTALVVTGMVGNAAVFINLRREGHCLSFQKLERKMEERKDRTVVTASGDVAISSRTLAKEFFPYAESGEYIFHTSWLKKPIYRCYLGRGRYYDFSKPPPFGRTVSPAALYTRKASGREKTAMSALRPGDVYARLKTDEFVTIEGSTYYCYPHSQRLQLKHSPFMRQGVDPLELLREGGGRYAYTHFQKRVILRM